MVRLRKAGCEVSKNPDHAYRRVTYNRLSFGAVLVWFRVTIQAMSMVVCGVESAEGQHGERST